MPDPTDEKENLEALDERLQDISLQTLQREIPQWFGGDSLRPRDRGRWICFLGTGGSPRCMLTQAAHTGGFMINLPNFSMHADPGPGAILQANRYGLNPTALDAVYVSHAHTDHYTEANTMIEAMCRMMSQRRGYVLAPGELLQMNYISPFHQGMGTSTGPYRGGPEVTLAIKNNRPIELGEVMFTPHRAHHGGENYGFVLEYAGLKIGYTSDTSYVRSYRTTSGEVREAGSSNMFGTLIDFAEVVDYYQDLKEVYSQVDILVANVAFHHMASHRHLTGYGLAHLLTGSRVRRCFITHLDSVYFTNPGLAGELANYITRKTGVESLVPQEGTRYEL